MAEEKSGLQKSMQIGLGEAIQRLMHVELLRSRGIVTVPQEAKAERDMIVEALNTHMLDLGLDCNVDLDMGNSVQVFAHSAKTSCCRISTPGADKKSVSSSRRS